MNQLCCNSKKVHRHLLNLKRRKERNKIKGPHQPLKTRLPPCSFPITTPTFAPTIFAIFLLKKGLSSCSVCQLVTVFLTTVVDMKAGFSFVIYEHQSDADAAARDLNGYTLPSGRRLKVEVARTYGFKTSAL